MSTAAPGSTGLEAALDLASRGWRVLPLHSVDAAGCCTCGKIDCVSPGKHPRTKNGSHDATADEATIRRWWRTWPNANVGLGTGEGSGVFVLDVDAAKDGAASLADLKQARGPLPRTVRVRTGGGGEHLYFAYAGQHVRNRAGKLAPGLDVRCCGGFVVAPGSAHASGRRYEWADGCGPDEAPIAEAPAWLLELLRDQPRPHVDQADDRTIRFRDDTNAYATAALRDELDTLAQAPEGGRNDQLNESAFSLGQLVGAGLLDRSESETALEQTALAIGLSERETAATIRSGIEAGMREPRALPPPSVNVDGIRHTIPSPPAASPPSDGDHPPATEQAPAESHHLTDLGNARRLAARHGADLRYCHRYKEWHVWDGRRWKTDTTGEVERRAKETALSIYAEIQHEPSESQRKDLVKHAVRSEGEARIRAMIALASSEPGIPVTPADLDTDPWLLNTLDGTLDLRTGLLREHRRADLITKLAPVRYDPDARLELWERYLDTVTNGDQAFRDHLQRGGGYTLTGDTREEKLFFNHGPTATGKSTFLEAIKATMGDYATTADFEAFLARRSVGGPREDIARLAGARLVVSIEVDEGKRLAEGLVKMLTGGDTVTARHLYQKAFEFRPCFKLWLAANHEPKVSDEDEALWRRILREPFEHVIPEEERDPRVKATLRDPEVSGPAILAWLVRGCLKWQRDGLGVPPAVKKATEDYRHRMDPFAGFVSDVCALEDGVTLAADLWKAYQEWVKEDRSRRALSRTDFAHRLEAVGCQQGRGAKGVRLWRGIVLQDAPQQLGLRTEDAGGDASDTGDTGVNNFPCTPDLHGEVSAPDVTRVTRVTQSRTPAENAGREGPTGVRGPLELGHLVYPLSADGGWLTEQPVRITDVDHASSPPWYGVEGFDDWFPPERLEPVEVIG